MTFPPLRRRRVSAALTVAGLAVTLGVSAGVGADALQPSPALADAPPAADFYNPVLKGADPSIVRDGDVYYSVSSDAEGIWVRRSTSLATMSDGVVQKVWEPDDAGSLCCNVWAPELLLIRGEWYIYFAADL
ncbi:MAG: hypothetical protein EOO67_01480, partial [Microbacterium sp.]